MDANPLTSECACQHEDTHGGGGGGRGGRREEKKVHAWGRNRQRQRKHTSQSLPEPAEYRELGGLGGGDVTISSSKF